MMDEAIFQGSRLCVVGNICRDVKTAPLDAEERLLRDGETLDRVHCGNDWRRRRQ